MSTFKYRACALAVAALGMIALAFLPVLPEAQRYVAAAGLGGMFVLVFLGRRLRLRHARGDLLRVGVMLFGLFLTLRYLFWRLTETIGWHDPLSLLAALLLLAAELYGITIYFLGVFVNIQPRERRAIPLPDDPADCPTVDVVVPSYNESPELLETTLLAATQLRYPPGRVRVYLLDDGATLAKRSDPDPEKAGAARRRGEALEALCERVGARYLSRERNDHAKAGNINAALEHLHGELLLILDADHVPTMDFLEQTVGQFVADPKLFLVQTPHNFVNPDPIEKNLGTFERMPAENEMFYGVIQKGLDAWGASFFCGSAAILRRSCLDEIGGIQGETVTEDAETALTLHARGYRSAYLSRPLISGLQPETFSGFVTQRVRWAQGMVQIFLRRNPWLQKGLSLPQRLSYTSSSFFWFFPLARTVFLLAPASYLLFGLRIYDANLEQFLVYAVPHVLGALLVSELLYGRVRWAFVSELYETMQSLYALPAIVQVLLNPARASFKVTPKGERLEEDFVTSLATPFIVLTLITVISLGAAFWRWPLYPEQHGVIVITALWELLNLYILISALGALLERRQRRAVPRIHVPMDLRATLELADGNGCEVFIRDLSDGGARIVRADGTTPPLLGPGAAVLSLDVPALGRRCRFRVRIIDTGAAHTSLRFTPRDLSERREVVALVRGSSEWMSRAVARRHSGPGIVRAAWFLLGTGVRGVFQLGLFELRRMPRRLAAAVSARFTKGARRGGDRAADPGS